MTQKEKLIELINNADKLHGSVYAGVKYPLTTPQLTDYLLANGVVVLPCKIGEKFYLVYEFGVVEERECCGFSIFNGEIEIIDEVDSRYRDSESEYYRLFFSREAAEAASKKMETELKPCPFCGGKARITQTLSQTPRFLVGCFGNCFVELPLLYNTREDAIEAWNRRVTDATD